MKSQVLRVAGQKILPGERRRIYIEVASLYDHTQLSIPVEVIRGKRSGPSLFISAAIHGDEINGVEIIKRLLKKKSIEKIKGTLFLIPVVNVFGFNTKSRYLPDRRDLNRSFPGRKNGSLASRLAYIFMKEVVRHCTHGIDLHTGALNRKNLPQIRACMDDDESKELAQSFGVPVLVHSELRDGSLREAARRKGVKTLLFEGGEALRFDESVIRAGVNGCLRVMKKIGMLEGVIKEGKSHLAKRSQWIRAPKSGSFRNRVSLGASVNPGQILAEITDPFGDSRTLVLAEEEGVVIGISQVPLVNRGDAMFHIGLFTNPRRVRSTIDMFDEALI
ncbi:MAG: succinylglutamate desuccinylase/aspartoacylase family protein [Bdellovibrionales bacterium]